MKRGENMGIADRPTRIVVGITGASGAAYARRLLECLCESGVDVHLIITPHGRQLLRDELGISEATPESLLGRSDTSIIMHGYRDVGDVLASGSFLTDGMIVCPCSGNTLAAVAAGQADNLLTRAAAVTLKESRRLILVPREMPVSRIELLNCLRLNEAGAVICPASPGFYMLPKSIDDLLDFVVGKLLDLVNVCHSLRVRWADQRNRNEHEARS